MSSNSARDQALRQQAKERREAQIASTEAMNNLILGLDSLNKAIECYRRAKVHNLALLQIRDDLDEEIHAIWKDDNGD